jgi:tRNA(adenine34) deaminase
MCAGAILNAGIDEVVFGATDTNMGACGGVINIFEEAFGFKPKLYGGFMAEECAQVLKDFFAKLR